MRKLHLTLTAEERQTLEIARYRPEEVIVLFADELTYYNHATPAADYAPGGQQPKAGLAIGGERSWRAIAALDAFSGALVWEQASKVRISTFVRFLKKVRQTYLQALTGLCNIEVAKLNLAVTLYATLTPPLAARRSKTAPSNSRHPSNSPQAPPAHSPFSHNGLSIILPVKR